MCAIARSKKYKVIGFDISKKRTEDVANKICPIKDETCEQDLKEVKFQVSSDSEILKDTDYFIICVPTPIYSDYNPNYEPLIGAAKIVGKYLKKGAKVIVESTINPGTCEEVVQPELEKVSKLKCGVDFSLAHCPERINPGDPKWNVYNIPRNVGSIPEDKAEEYAEFYRSFIKAEVNAVSNIKVAESTKIIENTFRDLNIAFVNELAQSFDKMGIDLHETIKAASNKPFAFMAHYPGCGVGGHCIAVDPYYLIKKAETSGFNHRFLKEARAINNFMPRYAVMRLMEAMNEVGKPLKGSKVVLLGMSYKPNVGDTRESPSYEVLEILEEYGADVTVIDPYVAEFNQDLDLALDGADAIFLATSHKEFVTKLKPAYLSRKGIKVVADGRNVLDRKGIMDKGIIYKGIGR
jgi:nucleotide sugar dehydrogenase